MLNEIELRKKNKLPPFYRFISIIITGKNEKQTINEALKVKNQITKDIKEEKIPITNNKALKIKFTLTVTYCKDFGKIEFEGSIMTLPDEGEFKSIMDSWKDKKIPENMKFGIFNFIMNKCNVKALHLEDEMGMPLHIPMPRLSKEIKKKE